MLKIADKVQLQY